AKELGPATALAVPWKRGRTRRAATSRAASSGAKASRKAIGPCEPFRRRARRGCRSAATATAKQIHGPGPGVWTLRATVLGHRHPANRGAPKAPIKPAQPSGLGHRTGEAKALKARSISIPGITLVEFGPMPWRQQPVFFLETPRNGCWHDVEGASYAQ